MNHKSPWITGTNKCRRNECGNVGLSHYSSAAAPTVYPKCAYIVNPYQIVANNGRFYIIGNCDKYDNVAHFRVDKMTDVKILDEKAKPMKEIPELKDGLNLPRHMAEHMYMFSGESIPVKLETTEDMMQELVDWFGNDFHVEKIGNDKIRARINCNAKAMRFWTLQYGPYVEVLEPKEIRDRLSEDIKSMAEKYK